MVSLFCLSWLLFLELPLYLQKASECFSFKHPQLHLFRGIAFFSTSPSLLLTLLSIAVKLLPLDPHTQYSQPFGLLARSPCVRDEVLITFQLHYCSTHAPTSHILQHGFSYSNLAVLLCDMKSSLLSLVFQAFYIITQSILPGSIKSQILFSSQAGLLMGLEFLAHSCPECFVLDIPSS